MPASNISFKPNLKGEFVIKNDQNNKPAGFLNREVLLKRNTHDTLSKEKNKPVQDNTKSTGFAIKSHDQTNRLEATEHQTVTPFTSLALHPNGVTFQDQKTNEEIILLIRKHFVTNIPWILATLILSFVPIVFIPVFPTLFPFIQISISTQIAFTFLYYLSLFSFSLVNFVAWYFHLGIVTNERIIDIDTSGILYRNVAETKLELVEDISHTQVGVLSSFFNYGNVDIQTAGNNPNFEFDKAPEPGKIRHIIGQLIGKT